MKTSEEQIAYAQKRLDKLEPRLKALEQALSGKRLTSHLKTEGEFGDMQRSIRSTRATIKRWRRVIADLRASQEKPNEPHHGGPTHGY